MGGCVAVYDERSAMRGLVNQELLLRNEYLAAENYILRAHLPTRLRLSDAERSTLAEIAKRLGRKALKDVARVAKPDTLLGWYRRLVARKFDGSHRRACPGRPRISPEVERWCSDWHGRTAAGDTIRRGTTKARTISCCSRSLCLRQVREAQSVVESGSAAYSNTTVVPHEYFPHTPLTFLRSACNRP
jgi:hypothetical protein